MTENPAPATRATSPGRDEYVRTESVRMLYKHLPPILLANITIACVTVYVMWEVVTPARLLVWLAAMAVVSALRLALLGAYRRRQGGEDDRRWGRYFVLGSLGAGTLWGLAGMALVLVDQLAYQLLLLFVVAGLGAGAISSLTAYLPAFYAFLLSMMVPAGLGHLLSTDDTHLALGAMVVFYTLALSFFARNINASLRNTLELRFANTALVAQLREQKEEAEQANRGKSRFLAAASHDLRQPLHALTLFTSALHEQAMGREMRRIVDHIGISVAALQSLFNAILDVSRLDAGVLQPERSHFPLDALFKRLHNDYATEAQGKGLRLRVVPTRLLVYSDQAMLERILRNLLSNAIRYTRQGGVVLGCRRQGEQVRILVCDTGSGIPGGRREEIFEEFVQLGNPERDRNKGLGLGLAIVRRTAKLLGHPVAVDSQMGRGSCFAITLPRGNPAAAADAQTEVMPPWREEETLCVLVIDDESAVREGMRTLLAGWGCTVEVAASAKEALARVSDGGCRPDVVLADYRLRDDKTGIDAVRAIEAMVGGAVPALIVTGDTAVEHLREAEASGYRVVHKPVQAAKLRAYLRQIDKQRRRQEDAARREA